MPNGGNNYEVSRHSPDCMKQVVFHNDAAREGDTVFVSNCVLAPGGKIDMHAHEDMDECFIFKGIARFIKFGKPHWLNNNSNEPMKFVCVGIRRTS